MSGERVWTCLCRPRVVPAGLEQGRVVTRPFLREIISRNVHDALVGSLEAGSLGRGLRFFTSRAQVCMVEAASEGPKRLSVGREGKRHPCFGCGERGAWGALNRKSVALRRRPGWG